MSSSCFLRSPILVRVSSTFFSLAWISVICLFRSSFFDFNFVSIDESEPSDEEEEDEVSIVSSFFSSGFGAGAGAGVTGLSSSLSSGS